MSVLDRETIQWVGRLGLTSLLVGLAVYDWRCRRVPNWAVQPILVAGVACLLVQLVRGQLGFDALAWVGGTWAACLFLWWLRAFGGGDMKLVMALIALAPGARLIYLLLAAALAGLVLNLAFGEGRVGLRRFVALLATASQGALPTRAEIAAAYQARGRPITFAFSLAGITYLWLFWAGH